MLKRIGFFIFFCVCFSLMSTSDVWATEITPIYINGVKQEFVAAPYAVNGSIVVPVRQIAEAFKVSVDWDEKTQQATITRGDDVLVLRLGSEMALYNDVKVPLPIKPQTRNNTTFLPLRYVAEWLQLQVDFKDGAVYLQPAELGDTPDTLTLSKGNSNANLAAGGDMLLWQNKIYFRYGMYIEGLSCIADVVKWTPQADDDYNPERLLPKDEMLLPGDNYSHFNVWQGEIYAICNNNFVKLGTDFKPVSTIISNVCYAQIQDGWIYYITKSDIPENEKLYRQSLIGGNSQDLGLKNILCCDDNWLRRQILITDNHIYAYVQNSAKQNVLFAMSLDGSNRQEIIRLDGVEAMDYADGYLYFNLVYDDDSLLDNMDTICSSLHRIKTDGTRLYKISDNSAEYINIQGDWLYFSHTEPGYTSDDGSITETSRRICRIRKDFRDYQILTDGPVRNMQLLTQPMFYNNRLFFTEKYTGNGQKWWEIQLNE